MAGALTQRSARLLDRVWGLLRRPALAMIVGLLLILILLAAQALPQAPGQTRDDPAAAQRWVNLESERWGAPGEFMRITGLFDVLSSPLFLVLLALAVLMTLVHLADALERARLPARLRRLADVRVTQTIAAIPTPDAVARSRVTWPESPLHAADALRELLSDRAGPILVDSHSDEEGGEPAADRRRFLAARRLPVAWLRLLLPIGVLLLLAFLWARALWGWSVTTPTLAPGDTYAWSQHAIAVDYTLQGSDATAAPDALGLTVGETRSRLPASAGGATVGQTNVVVRPTSPALWLHTEDSLLQQPGEIETRNSLGLAFAQPGNEQVVVLPGYGAGLRAVLTDGAEPKFLVEIFAVEAEQPVQRKEIRATEVITLPIAGREVALRFQPSQSLTVEVTSTPLQWLLIPSALLIAAGAVGYIFQTTYALAEVVPWPNERSAITVLANTPALVEAVQVHGQGASVDSGDG